MGGLGVLVEESGLYIAKYSQLLDGKRGIVSTAGRVPVEL